MAEAFLSYNIVMSSSIEKFYRTQPPLQIGELKLNSVLEYLIFSGIPLHVSILKEDARPKRISETVTAIDVNGPFIVIEAPESFPKLSENQSLSIAFGYKRKRASFETKVSKIENQYIYCEKPRCISLSNLRRNPRLVVEKPSQDESFQVEMEIKTATGSVSIHDAEIYEVSQLGMSLFISRDVGMILPGDRVSSLKVSISGKRILHVEGSVSRVDPKRRSSSMSNSYQIVVLFRRKDGDSKQRLHVKRLAKRVPVFESKPCYFSAEHPFFPGRRIEGQVFEISSSGLSVVLEKTSFPVIPGMRFSSCHLQLPFCPPRDLIFEVAHVEFKSDGEVNHFRVGGEFINAPIELLKDISNYTNEVEKSFVRDLNQEDLDLLWQFMFETNFIYPAKRKQIQNKSREILETYHRLMSQENPLVKKIIYQEGDEIKGHLSGLRFYDHAWVIQHLNAAKSSIGSAAQNVLKNMTSFLLDSKAHEKNNIFYVISYYRPDNLYPAILFGDSKRMINDPDKCDSYDFVFGVFDENQSFSSSGSPKIDMDSPEAYQELTDYLVQLQMSSFLRATGLAQARPWELKIKPEFDRLGLHRERRIIRLHDLDHQVFALAEVASSGLNLSELTNCIYLFTEGENPEVLRDLATQAVRLAYENFYVPHDIIPTVLTIKDMAHAQNVAWSKTYTCWILAERAMSEFDAASSEIFNNFKAYLAEFRKLQAIENQNESSAQHESRIQTRSNP